MKKTFKKAVSILTTVAIIISLVSLNAFVSTAQTQTWRDMAQVVNVVRIPGTQPTINNENDQATALAHIKLALEVVDLANEASAELAAEIVNANALKARADAAILDSGIGAKRTAAVNAVNAYNAGSGIFYADAQAAVNEYEAARLVVNPAIEAYIDAADVANALKVEVDAAHRLANDFLDYANTLIEPIQEYTIETLFAALDNPEVLANGTTSFDDFLEVYYQYVLYWADFYDVTYTPISPVKGLSRDALIDLLDEIGRLVKLIMEANGLEYEAQYEAELARVIAAVERANAGTPEGARSNEIITNAEIINKSISGNGWNQTTTYRHTLTNGFKFGQERTAFDFAGNGFMNVLVDYWYTNEMHQPERNANETDAQYNTRYRNALRDKAKTVADAGVLWRQDDLSNGEQFYEQIGSDKVSNTWKGGTGNKNLSITWGDPSYVNGTETNPTRGNRVNAGAGNGQNSNVQQIIAIDWNNTSRTVSSYVFILDGLYSPDQEINLEFTPAMRNSISGNTVVVKRIAYVEDHQENMRLALAALPTEIIGVPAPGNVPIMPTYDPIVVFPIIPPPDRAKGSLQIVKEQGLGGDTFPANASFTFKVTIGGVEQPNVILNSANNFTSTLSNLDEGLSYRVEEVWQPRYTLNDVKINGVSQPALVAEGTIAQNTTIAVVFTNVYDAPRGQIALTKTVSGGDANLVDSDKVFTFNVTIGDTTHQVRLKAGETWNSSEINEQGFLTGTLYTIVETGDLENFTVTGEVKTGTAIVEGPNPITVNNQYDAPRGQIALRKTVSGGDANLVDSNKVFTFNVTIGDTTYPVSLKAGETWNSSEINAQGFLAGTLYTIVETGDLENFTVTGEVKTGTAIVEGVTSVTVNNQYDAPRGQIALTKTVSGGDAELVDPDKVFTFDVTIGGTTYPVSLIAGGTWNSSEINPQGFLTGTLYTIVETGDLEYFTVTGEVTTETAIVEGVNPVTINNNYGAPRGQIALTKTVSGGDAELVDPDKVFTFDVTIGGTTYPVSLIAGGIWNSSEINAQGFIAGTPYTIVETGDLENFTVTGEVKTETAIVEGANPVTINNQYDAPRGQIALTKTVRGGDANLVDSDKVFTFDVTIGDTKHQVSLKAGEIWNSSEINEQGFIAGTLYTIVETGDLEYFTVTGEVKTETAIVEGVTPITVNNQYDAPRGQIALTKTVSGGDANLVDSNKVFTFDVTIGGTKYPVSLKAGEIWNSSEINPQGFLTDTLYTIVETGDLENFTVTGEVKTETAIVEGVNPVTINNQYDAPRGTISLTKVVTGESSLAPDVDFVFNITIGEDEFNGVELKAGAIWKPTDENGVKTYLGGTTYTIEEVDVPANFAAQETIVGTIQVDESNEVVEVTHEEFTNTYTAPRGTIELKKVVTGESSLAPDVDFVFNITIGEDEFNGVELKADGTWKPTDENDVVKTYLEGTTYTIEEVDVPANFAAQETIVGTIQVDESNEVVEFTHEEFTNTYTAPRGTIELKKVVTGESSLAPDVDFVFDVTINGVTEKVTLNKANNLTWTSENQYLLGTEYTIVETSEYANFTNVSGTVTGAITEIGVKAVTFENSYTAPRGNIVLTKTVTGEGAPADAVFTFEVIIDGNKQVVTLKANETWTSASYLVGTKYSVTETNVPENFTYVSGNIENATVVVGTNAVGVVNNYKTPEQPTPPRPIPPTPIPPNVIPDDIVPEGPVEIPESPTPTGVYQPDPVEIPEPPTPRGVIEFPSETNPGTGVSIAGLGAIISAGALMLARKKKKD